MYYLNDAITLKRRIFNIAVPDERRMAADDTDKFMVASTDDGKNACFTFLTFATFLAFFS